MSPVGRVRYAWQQSRWQILGTALAMSILFAAGVGIYVRTLPEPWDPLGPYAVQQVLGDPVDIPMGLSTAGSPRTVSVVVVDYDGSGTPEVNVVATKCNNSPEPVTIRGSSALRSIEPPGSSFGKAPGLADRPSGCTAYRYSNPLPAALLDRVRDLGRRGTVVTLWQNQGEETPYRPDGTTGVTRTWQTENFAIRYTGPGA